MWPEFRLLPLILAGVTLVAAQDSPSSPITTRRTFGLQGFSGHVLVGMDNGPVMNISDVSWAMEYAKPQRVPGAKYFMYYDSRDAGFTTVGARRSLAPWYQVTYGGPENGMQLTGIVDNPDSDQVLEEGTYLGNLSYIGSKVFDSIPVYLQNNLLKDKVILDVVGWPPDVDDYFKTYKFHLADSFPGRMVITGANIVANMTSEGTPGLETSKRTVDFMTPTGQRSSDPMFVWTGDWSLATFRVKDNNSPTIHNLRYLNGSGNAEVTIKVPANTTTMRINAMIGQKPYVTLTPVSRPDLAKTTVVLSTQKTSYGTLGPLWFTTLDPKELYTFTIAGNTDVDVWADYGSALTTVDFESYYSDGHSDPVPPEIYDMTSSPDANTDNSNTAKTPNGTTSPGTMNDNNGVDGTNGNRAASSPAKGNKVNVGAIAGGIVGGVIVLLLLLVLAFFIGRRRREAPVKAMELNSDADLTPITAIRSNSMTTPFSDGTEHLRSAPFLSTPSKVASPTPFSKAQSAPFGFSRPQEASSSSYPPPVPLASRPQISEGSSSSSGWSSPTSAPQPSNQASIEVEFEEDAGLLQPIRQTPSVPRAVLPPNYNPQWADAARESSEPDEEDPASGPPRPVLPAKS